MLANSSQTECLDKAGSHRKISKGGWQMDKKTFNIKFRDMEWVIFNAEKEAKKSERLANFSLGFSVFTLVFIMFVELVIKK